MPPMIEQRVEQMIQGREVSEEPAAMLSPRWDPTNESGLVNLSIELHDTRSLLALNKNRMEMQLQVGWIWICMQGNNTEVNNIDLRAGSDGLPKILSKIQKDIANFL